MTVDESSLARPPNVVGTVGFLLVTIGLLGAVAAFLVLSSFLHEMQGPVDPTATVPVEVDDDLWLTVVAGWCAFGIILVGTIASVVGLGRRPRKLAIWGAAIGLTVVSMVLTGFWWSPIG